jgi:hypothetical protein
MEMIKDSKMKTEGQLVNTQLMTHLKIPSFENFLKVK